MANILAELRQRQHDLKAEASALLNKAEADAGGVLSEEQNTRIEAIKVEAADLDQQLDAAIAGLDTAPNAAEELASGIAQGWAGAVAVAEVCVVANVPAKRVLGFLKDKATAEDARKAVLSERALEDEISARHNPKADKPASWDKAVNKVNSSKK
ncbi:hypothetical protein [Mesorhizobium sp.]|uniref:hypothetical protein n=1 Tax=Mesorhizobium sp. TaxID=1871066 RepID=UPI000FE68DCD|nr:hypothetical protein [Mesorhizobium sp.]RWO90920.1 MAG: hypothetical protein EOQ95_13670 [Mesorhizobium sp.]